MEAERKDEQKRIEKEKREKEEAVRRAKNAPDKEKLFYLSTQLKSLELPDVTGDDAKKIIENVKALIYKTAKYINDEAINL